MIYVFNKNKIVSYMVASIIVISLFVFSSTTIPNDIELLKVSSNVTSNNIENNNMKNN